MSNISDPSKVILETALTPKLGNPAVVQGCLTLIR